LAINKELDKRGCEEFPIIVPLVYGERQKRIMLEDFKYIIEENPNSILLDEFYGQILNELFFKGDDFNKHLEHLLKNQPKLEEKLRDYLSGTLKLKRFGGSERVINDKDISFEISHNPRVATGFKYSFYTTIGYFSEILERASLEESLGFDKTLLMEVKTKIADKIENDKKIHFMPEPFVFSYDEKRKKLKDEIFTPPFIHVPRENKEDVPEGMYVMITGIDGLMGLFDEVSKFGMKLYYPPFIKNIEGADNTHTPEFVANPNIKFQFGRTGWSTVWWSHMTETPLIAPAYTKGDDPEIYFNEKTVKKFGLATIFNPSLKSKDILLFADPLRYDMKKINEILKSNYGILDGIDYTANIIVDFIINKDISHYRNVNPCLR